MNVQNVINARENMQALDSRFEMKLSNQEREKLTNLAKDSGYNNMSEVLRSLIAMADGSFIRLLVGHKQLMEVGEAPRFGLRKPYSLKKYRKE